MHSTSQCVRLFSCFRTYVPSFVPSFSICPLFFVDVWDAVDRLEQVLKSGEWQEPRFSVRAAVT